MTQTDFDIFLSYKREQRHLVEQLYRRLISEGYCVVYDNSMGTRDIVGDAISKWIDSAKLVIVLWTDHNEMIFPSQNTTAAIIKNILRTYTK